MNIIPAKLTLEQKAEACFKDYFVWIERPAYVFRIHFKPKTTEAHKHHLKYINTRFGRAYFERIVGQDASSENLDTDAVDDPSADQIIEVPNFVSDFVCLTSSPSSDRYMHQCISDTVKSDVCRLNDKYVWVQGKLLRKCERIDYFQCRLCEVFIEDEKQKASRWRLRSTYEGTYEWIEEPAASDGKHKEIKNFLLEWTQSVPGNHYGLLSIGTNEYLLTACAPKSPESLPLTLWIDNAGQAHRVCALSAAPGVTVHFMRDGKIHGTLCDETVPYIWENGVWHIPS